MQKVKNQVFATHSFDEEVDKLFTRAEAIAAAHDEKQLCSGHLFAACLHLRADLVHKLLGRDITRLPDHLEFDADAAEPAGGPDDGIDLAPELAALFLEDFSDSPFMTVREYTASATIGIAEILVALLMDPGEEISGILIENEFPNSAVVLEKLVRENFLRHLREFTTIAPVERMRNAIEKAGAFEKFMCSALHGQRKAISDIAAQLSRFWCNGNDGLPLVILLLSEAGGGRSAFARHMQEAFVELGLQSRVEPPLDLSGFLHDSSCEVDLLGDARSFRNADCGKLYGMMRYNRRGVLVFEDIHCGARNAKNVLRSFANNLAMDKYFEEVMILPQNVLLLTMKIDADQYRFVREKCGGGVTAKLLNELFCGRRKTADNWASVNEQNAVAAESRNLWERADKIVLLDRMSDEELKTLADEHMDRTLRLLKEDYGIDCGCTCRDRLIQMIMQSSPDGLGPGALIDRIDDALDALWPLINRHGQVRRIEIDVAELPEYKYDPARRTIRGDYLVFTRNERVDGELLHLNFADVRYTRQERVDCGHYRIERPKGTTFDDIVGLDDVRDELLDALFYITNSDKLGANVPAPNLNYLLVGSPGNGKSSMAQALANFADIPVFFAGSSIFSDARELSAMFRRAAEMAPAIVVLEEFNSIGNSRDPFRREAVNELLAILDGSVRQSKLLVIASTNHPEQLEEALLRCGRFGRQIRIDLPNAEARDIYVRRFEKKYEVVLTDEVRSAFVAKTSDISFADIGGILGYALRHSMRRHRRFDREALDGALAKFVGSRQTTSIGFSRGGEQ